MNRRERIDAKKRDILAKAAAVKRRKLPTSGGEEQFTNATFGSKQGIADNNCYGYAVDWYRDSGGEKLQPGELSGTLRPADDLTRCDVLSQRTLADLATKAGGGYPVRPAARCKPGYYKVMSFVAPGKDYHWYRQMGDMVLPAPGGKTTAQLAEDLGVDPSQIDSPSPRPGKCDKFVVWRGGLWAHKRGLDELTTRDAKGRWIFDPREADRDYGSGLDYTKFCGAYCVSTDFGKGA